MIMPNTDKVYRPWIDGRRPLVPSRDHEEHLRHLRHCAFHYLMTLQQRNVAAVYAIKT